jgi:diguanylate cyclase (GGDEF)-like protein
MDTHDTALARPSTDAETTSREVVEDVYELLNRSDLDSREFERGLEDLSRVHGDVVYSQVLHTLCHLQFPPATGHDHWRRILSHRAEMQRKLGDSVDLRVALASYFLQIHRRLHNPKLIELRLYEQTRASAYRDELTGLYNYRFFVECLAQEILRTERCGLPLTLVMIDVDDFKIFNDTHGHDAGNHVLATVAGLIGDSCRRADVAARYGGEEFALILPSTSKVAADSIADRIRDSVEKHSFDHERFQPGGSLTVSMGIATCPVDATTASDLVRCADRALYVAKAGGKNRVERYGNCRRSFRRVEIAAAGEVACLSAVRHRLTTTDLSEGGLRFVTDAHVAPDALVELRIDLGEEQPVTIIARVVHVEHGAPGSTVAVRFLDVSSADRSHLVKQLRRRGRSDG